MHEQFPSNTSAVAGAHPVPREMSLSSSSFTQKLHACTHPHTHIYFMSTTTTFTPKWLPGFLGMNI